MRAAPYHRRMPSHRRPGDHAVLRHVVRGAVWTAWPAVLVEDSEELAALWIPAGTRWRAPVWPSGAPGRIPSADGWTMREQVWRPPGVLMLAPSGEPFAVRIECDAANDQGGESRGSAGFYVDLTQPLGRSRLGFDTFDHVLDLVIDADGGARWKDEDELAEAVRLGVFTPPQAREFRVTGERALELARRREPPFDARWDGWRPDAAWTLPALPEDWDRVP